MHVVHFENYEQLRSVESAWNALAGGRPFCRSEWLATWWRHYGELSSVAKNGPRLMVLGVYDSASHDQLLGLAPWCVEPSWDEGRVARFLGKGEVYSDHVSMLSRAGSERPVATALANWLTENVGQWGALDLHGIQPSSLVTQLLVEQLGDHGHAVHHREGEPNWRVPLPESWDEYLAMLSKSHRKQVRRFIRRLFDTGRAQFNTVEREEELPAAFEQFRTLHQKRWNHVGQPGSFHSTTFTEFLREASSRLLGCGSLRINFLELDGRTIAADFNLVGESEIYVYQGGYEPDAIDLEPGRLLTVATIRQAIEQGYRGYDFLCGEVPYKAHWRAQANELQNVRVVPKTLGSQLRHGVWLGKHRAKNWVKQLTS